GGSRLLVYQEQRIAPHGFDNALVQRARAGNEQQLSETKSAPDEQSLFRQPISGRLETTRDAHVLTPHRDFPDDVVRAASAQRDLFRKIQVRDVGRIFSS